MKLLRCLVPLFGLSLCLGAAVTPAPELEVPEGFTAQIVADDLMAGRQRDALRFLAVSPEGFVYAKTYRGGIIALRDSDGDGTFDQKQEFGSGGGTGIAWHEGWLYHSTNTAVYRYRMQAGELLPKGAPELIVKDLPDKGTHNAKSFAFDADGRLLVEIGSPNNVYSEPDRQYGAKGKDATEYLKTYGGFWYFDPSKQEQAPRDGRHFATGHRHVLAVAWQPKAGAFYIVMMGRDNLNTVAPEYYDALDNAERVAEEMHRLSEGVNLGWPYTYYDPVKKARMLAPEFGGDNRKRAEDGRYDEPVLTFPAHWAPLQMLFYTGTQFPEKYRGGAFIAFHGSWNRAPLPQDGFNLAFVPFDIQGKLSGNYEVFANNLYKGKRYRMGGVALGPDGSLYLSETDKGRIWRIRYTGATGTQPAMRGTGPAAKTQPMNLATHPGRSVYERYCAVCHMDNGSGAGRMNPALQGSTVVKGSSEILIRTVLEGPEKALPSDRPQYANRMPAFPHLTNEEIAHVLTYVRAAFGENSAPISREEVARVRR